MAKASYVRWLDGIRLKDLHEVGGKNASLGELNALLAADGGGIPTASRSPPMPITTRSMPLGLGESCVSLAFVREGNFAPLSL